MGGILKHLGVFFTFQTILFRLLLANSKVILLQYKDIVIFSESFTRLLASLPWLSISIFLLHYNFI